MRIRVCTGRLAGISLASLLLYIAGSLLPAVVPAAYAADGSGACIVGDQLADPHEVVYFNTTKGHPSPPGERLYHGVNDPGYYGTAAGAKVPKRYQGYKRDPVDPPGKPGGTQLSWRLPKGLYYVGAQIEEGNTWHPVTGTALSSGAVSAPGGFFGYRVCARYGKAPPSATPTPSASAYTGYGVPTGGGYVYTQPSWGRQHMGLVIAGAVAIMLLVVVGLFGYSPIMSWWQRHRRVPPYARRSPVQRRDGGQGTDARLRAGRPPGPARQPGPGSRLRRANPHGLRHPDPEQDPRYQDGVNPPR